MSDWRVGYRKAVAEFLKKRGVFVGSGAYRDWISGETLNDYDSGRAVYGWGDPIHTQGREWTKPPQEGCKVVSVDFESLRERSLSLFTDTFHSNEMVAGVEVRATCACRYYENKWLRWDGSVSEILPELLKEDS